MLDADVSDLSDLSLPVAGRWRVGWTACSCLQVGKPSTLCMQAANARALQRNIVPFHAQTFPLFSTITPTNNKAAFDFPAIVPFFQPNVFKKT